VNSPDLRRVGGVSAMENFIAGNYQQPIVVNAPSSSDNTAIGLNNLASAISQFSRDMNSKQGAILSELSAIKIGVQE